MNDSSADSAKEVITIETAVQRLVGTKYEGWSVQVALGELKSNCDVVELICAMAPDGADFAKQYAFLCVKNGAVVVTLEAEDMFLLVIEMAHRWAHSPDIDTSESAIAEITTAVAFLSVRPASIPPILGVIHKAALQIASNSIKEIEAEVSGSTSPTE